MKPVRGYQEFINGLGMAKNYLTTVIFVAVFPGFYVYHCLAGLGFIPLFAGGWASLWNLIGAIVLLPLVLWDGRNGNWKRHRLFAALVGIVILYLLYFSLFGEEYQRHSAMPIETMKLLLGWICLYCVGYFIFHARSLKLVVFASFVVMTAIPLIWFNRSDMSFILERMPTAPKGVSDYIGLATAYLVVAVFAITMAETRAVALLVILFGTFTLYLLSSRADMGGFVLAGFGWAYLQLSRHRHFTAFAGAAAPVLMVLALLAMPRLEPIVAYAQQAVASAIEASRPAPKPVIVAPQGTAMTSRPAPAPVTPRPALAAPARQPDAPAAPEGNSRQEAILHLAEDPSLSIRLKLMKEGIDKTLASPIVGDYGGQIRDHGEFGLYIHDILGVWQAYGLFAFMIYFILTLVPFSTAFGKVLSGKGRDRRWDMIYLMGGVCLVLVWTFKSAFWPEPALVWGMVAALIPFNRTITVRPEPMSLL